MKKILSISFLLLYVLCSAYSQKGWKWDTTIYYDENDNIKFGARLELNPSVTGEVVIPDYKIIKGKEYPVVSVRDEYKSSRKFKYGTYTKVILPKYIQEIDLKSNSLQELLFKEGAWYIKWLNISNESKIKRIVFPNSAWRIGRIMGNGYTLQDYPRKGEEFYKEGREIEVVLPRNLRWIDDEAFSRFHIFGKLVLPKKMNYIGKKAFYRSSITELVMPEEIKQIGADAFAYNGIHSVVLPIKVNGKCEESIFAGNYAISNISVHGNAVPEWIGKKECKGLASGVVGSWAYDIEHSYSRFMKGKNEAIRQKVSKWQERTEFETTEEWKKRVTEKARNEYVKSVVEELKQEYINKEKSSYIPKRILLAYDVDNQIFPIKIERDTLYVKVPRAEAPDFKTKFSQESVSDLYDISNDRLAVVGRSCIVDGKKYETTNTYAKADNLNDFALNLPPLEIDFGNNSNASASNKPAQSKTIDRTIDQNIPASGVTNANTFAVIIGNENYSMVAKVPFAKNDAQVFAEYCRKTLGIPSKNVRSYGDATFGMMKNAIKDIQNIANAYNGNINVIFYYAGHGIPNEHSKDAFLLPIDADGKETDICYPVSKLYQELGGLNAKQVVVLMDACFSGAQRGDGMLASARGVALKPKEAAPQGKMVVFSAASSDETAYPYNEKGHGMFTYFLLKKLRDTKGNCTLQEIGEYIKQNVSQQSVVINRKKQTPTVIPSQALMNNWQTMKLK